MTSFTVHGTPAPQGSKNQFGAEANPRTRPWRAAVAAEAANAHHGPLIDGPVHVTVTFAFVRPKAHYRTGRNAHLLRPDAPALMSTGPDLDKLQRAIGDALTGTVLRDDRQIAQWTAIKAWGDRALAQIAVHPIVAQVREAA